MILSAAVVLTANGVFVRAVGKETLNVIATESAGDALTAFRHDAPYLFLGAAFAAVGVLSAETTERPLHWPR